MSARRCFPAVSRSATSPSTTGRPPTGRCGGSPHLHTASSEGYVVIGGSGAVHTISRGGPEVHPLEAGSVVWFSPGTVHRLVNDGDLRLAGRHAELGTSRGGRRGAHFPGTHPRRPGRLRAAPPTLPTVAAEPPRTSSRRRRAPARDLAMTGYLELQEAMRTRGVEAWQELLTPAPPGSCSRRSRTGSAGGTPPSPPRPSARGRSWRRSPRAIRARWAQHPSLVVRRPPATADSECAVACRRGTGRRSDPPDPAESSGRIALSSEAF